ncbi:MAG TPA: ABC transporter ATP-binding protein [Saprospiraceae bacterium]|nr:ABC transporter ATP-binding protein [Saprospiraceae bacterium]
MDKPVIYSNDLTKNFGSFCAVNKICFEIKKGEIFGFLGANGAGKTTGIKMLTGLLTPSSGEARVAGFDVFTESEKIKKNIGYMSQKFSLYNDLTVNENIRFYAGVYGLSKKEIKIKKKELIAKLGLEDVQDTLAKELPLGWKQKLAFSIAIIHQPKVVFLDEPTGGVDPITRRQFWEMIFDASAAGITVLVTTHYMDEAEYCDRISIMVDGKIVALGTPKELKNQYNEEDMNSIFVKLARG